MKYFFNIGLTLILYLLKNIIFQAFLGAILNLEFGTVESLWREFWRSQDNNNDECEEEKYLSKEKLYSLSKCKTMQLFVKTVDFLFYQNLVKVLIPDVLRPVPGMYIFILVY